jgi:hypothetical protein
MRIIIYEGRRYEVPDWTRSIARDESGEVFAYSGRPWPMGDGWHLTAGEANGNQFMQVHPIGEMLVGWRESLMEIPT